MFEYIGQFKVPVHNLILDQCLEGIEYLHKEFHSLILTEHLLKSYVFSEVTLIAVLHYQVVVVVGLLEIVEFDDVGVVAGA